MLALAVAVAAVAGAAAVHAVAFSADGRIVDRAILHALVDVGPGGGKGWPDMLPHVVDEPPSLLMAAAISLYAFARRSRELGIALALGVLGASMTTMALKPLLAAARPAPFLAAVDQPSVHAWPSGHATAVVALALAAFYGAPRSLRRAVALIGGFVTAAVCSCLVVAAWHYPSDVLGGCLIALAWVLTAVVAASLTARRVRGRRASY